MDSHSRRILDAIRRLVRDLRESSRAAEREVGLSGAQLFVLHSLQGSGPLSVNDVAARTLTHQSSVSVVVAKLVARGLVARSRSPVDGRRVELSLTARGEKLARRAPETAPERLAAALVELPAAKRRQLAAGLTAVIDLMKLRVDEPAPMFFEEDRAQRTRSR